MKDKVYSSGHRRSNTMSASRFSLFVPHGSPMFALDPGQAGAAMSQVARGVEEPRAIVIVSPHWLTERVSVSFSKQLETIHDFYGFDQALYEMQYPAAGCPEGAEVVVQALKAAGLPVDRAERGLDHGAWVPLRQMFPEADVPVISMSVQPHLGPRHAYAVGRALAPLVAQGFCIIGSGNITHNLGDWRMAQMRGQGVPDYVTRFSDWVDQQLQSNQKDSLLDYRGHQADGVRAHPSDEHLLPLFTAWGAGGEQAKARPFFRGVSNHVIAMDGYVFEASDHV
jgi:4,5-DOPA dioxygenase extradiol